MVYSEHFQIEATAKEISYPKIHRIEQITKDIRISYHSRLP